MTTQTFAKNFTALLVHLIESKTVHPLENKVLRETFIEKFNEIFDSSIVVGNTNNKTVCDTLKY